MTTMETILVLCLIGACSVGNSVGQTPSYRTESRDDEQQADIVEASQGEEAQTANELKLLRKQFQSLQEGLSQLNNKFTSNAQSGYYGPPHYLHYYYNPARPVPYRPDSAPDTDELSVLRQSLQTSESRLQATEYKLQATESRLQVSEDNLQRTEARLQALEDRLGVEQDGPQATESRSGSCEDKLLVTQQRLKSAETKLQLCDQPPVTADSSNTTVKQGSTFVRWGRTECPRTAQLVYSGVAGGSPYSHHGSAGTRLCLTLEPQLMDMTLEHGAYLAGSEYQNYQGHHDHDVPCSVCLAPQSATIMVPATNTCPSGWTTHYTGYLAGDYNHPSHMAGAEFVCLDGEPENIPGGHENKNGALFYLVKTVCGSLPCPPYENDKVVTCAVCSL